MLHKRNKIYHVRLTAPNGRRVRRSTRTSDRKQAERYHDELKARLWREEQLGEKPRRSWPQAVKRWLDETKHKASHRDDVSRLRYLDKHLGKLWLDEITRDIVEQVISAKHAEGATNATVNRHTALIKAILRRAVDDWEWLQRAPKIRMLPEPKRRVRWITKAQAKALLSALPEPLAVAAAFALATGLRQGNVFGLTWDQVDLGREVAWIHADQAKAGQAIAVPLDREAVSVLKRQRGKHPKLCFPAASGTPLHLRSTVWARACRRAELDDFRFHDLRHTWASWHAQRGTPFHVLQELGGWRTPSMVQRYAHLAPEHLRLYVQNSDSSGTNLTQSPRELH